MSTPFRLRLPRSIYEEMLGQARTALPNECCGLLAGRVLMEKGEAVAEIVHCYPLVNALASPTEYESEPRSMFAAVRAIDRQGLDILAVYHSHPTSPPLPSRKDRERNFSPEVVNLIISLQGDEPHMRGWWLTEVDCQEAFWEVLD